MKPKSEFNPYVGLVIDPDKLERFMVGLQDEHIPECLAPDVKHAADVLAHITLLARIAPGFLEGLLAIVFPHFVKQHQRAVIGEMAQHRADAEGYGQEWRVAIEAGRSPRQKETYLWKTVALLMKSHDLNQAEAIKFAAEHHGREEEDFRRSVSRAKKRARKKT